MWSTPVSADIGREMNIVRSRLVDEIDSWAADHIQRDPTAVLHTETLGSVIDRICIASVSAEHVRRGQNAVSRWNALVRATRRLLIVVAQLPARGAAGSRRRRPREGLHPFRLGSCRSCTPWSPIPSRRNSITESNFGRSGGPDVPPSGAGGRRSGRRYRSPAAERPRCAGRTARRSGAANGGRRGDDLGYVRAFARQLVANGTTVLLTLCRDRDPAARRTPACGTSRSRASTRISCSPPPGASPAAAAPAAPPRRSLALDPAWSLPQSSDCRPCPPADQPEPSLRHGRRAPGTRGTPPADATAGQSTPPAPRNQPQPNTPGQQITDAKDRD
jgi:hypothetical protein